MGVLFLVIVVCVVLSVLGARGDWDSEIVGASLAFATMGAVGFVAGLIVFPPFVEARIDRHRVELRYVFLPRRVIGADEIDEIIILSRLEIPSRFGPVTTPRVLFRSEGRVMAAYTPRKQVSAGRELASLDLVPQVDKAIMTPRQAHRRYPGAVTVAERAMRPAALLAVAVGLGVLALLGLSLL